MTAAGSLTRAPRPDELYVLPPADPSLSRRRARLLAAVALAALALVAGGRVSTALGGVPASVPERRPDAPVRVVQRGDTLWSIARELQPSGDVRPLVSALVRANGGAELEVGQRLVLPG